MAVAAALVLLAACSATHHPSAVQPSPSSARPSSPSAASPPPTTHPSTSIAASTTTRTSTTTTVKPRPALPAPGAVRLLVAPALPGEAVWHPAGDELPGGHAVYTTALRPAAGVPSTGLVWIDQSATRLALYAGSGQPYGSWPYQYDVGTNLQPALMAAFNSGFKIYNYRTGWYEAGATAMPLQPGAASLVIFTDGKATVGEWGRDVGPGPTVAAVRQNLTLLVDGGAPTAASQSAGEWGAVLGGGWVTWRSAVGITGAGALIYAGGPDLTPALLANVLVAAGAVRAMEMDINPEWVSLSIYTHAGGIGHVGITGTNLLSGMYFSPFHYLQPASRDFFAVFAR
jgi:hypothetical protein